MDSQLIDQSMIIDNVKIKLESEESCSQKLDDHNKELPIDDLAKNQSNEHSADPSTDNLSTDIPPIDESSTHKPSNDNPSVIEIQQSVDQVNGEEEEDEANKDHCEDYVNFAIICSFFQQFGAQIGVNYSIETLKEMLENSKKISDSLIELHVKLLRKIKKYVNKERWENGLVKFLYEFSHLEAWQLEATGYQRIGLQFKIDLLKRLLEAQFDYNQKFKSEINNIETLLLRLVPIGRDLNGNQYWYHLDEEHTLRIYREQPNKDRDWKLICEDKDQFTQLIDNVESGQTEVCPVEPSVVGTPASENEEEKTTTKKKRGRKSKNKQVDKLINGHKEEERTLNNCVDSDQQSSRTETPVKDERPRRGRKPLNRSLFTPKIDRLDNKSTENESSLKEIKNEPTLIKQEKITDQRIDEDIELIVQQTISSLLDEIDSNNINNHLKTNDQIKNNINDTMNSTLDESTTTQEKTLKKRGRKKKGALNELSKLLGDNPPNNIEDFMPIKRSSRIQKLQEKKTAEMKMQIELEQKRLAELSRMKKSKSKKESTESVTEEVSDHEFYQEETNPLSDDSDESFKISNSNKIRKKNDESSDTENESISIKKKKRRGRKSKKEKLEVKKSKKNMKGNWSDEELFNFDEEEEEEPLKFDDKEDEFACEEIEEDAEPVILKRARTARKAKTEDCNEDLNGDCMNDDTPCQKCNLYSNPEWILLCDNCDLGYHTECLIPKLYIIPDGDWFCPKCENEQLLAKLKFEFENYVSNLAKREREQLRKERLKYVEINIGNILIEDSANRKNKAAKKKYNEAEYESDLDDSDLDDEDDNNDSNSATSNFDSDNSSAVNRRRLKYSSANRRRRNNRKSSYERSRPVARPRVQKQRKRRLSYSDESNDDSDSDELNSSQDDAASSGSLPKQRSARKRVSYQFKEYDDLINSAIQASDYDEYAEDEEQEDEEDSDEGKSPYSKGKDIANLMACMAAENPFETKEKDEPKAHNLTSDDVKELGSIERIDSNSTDKKKKCDDQDEHKIADDDKQQKGGKQMKPKRKLNDLDSPVEEAENDSDFTIKDESNTEPEDDETEMESNEFSNDPEEDDTDLSDWARGTRRRNTRSGGHKSSKRSKKKRRRFDSDDESDYGYKTRRTSKRVTYKEMSSTEDEELDDDYSDNSEKYRKNKKSAKKKQETESDELSASEQDSDERAVVKKKSKKRKIISSDDENESESSGEEGKRKSRREQKKKVYDDFTDIDESDEEALAEESVDPKLKIQSTPPENNESTGPPEKHPIETNIDQPPLIEVTQVQLPPVIVNTNEPFTENIPNPIVSSNVDKPPVVKRTPKIKITKPNPKLIKNQILNSFEPLATSVPTNSNELLVTECLQAPENINKGQSPSQLTGFTVDNSTDESVKKKRGRQPKNTPKEPKDPNAPQPKRGRKPKIVNTVVSEDLLVNVNNSNKVDQLAISNSALSQLTQFAASGDLGKLDAKSLRNPQQAAIDSMKQLLNNPLLAQQQEIARQTALINNINNFNDQKSQLNELSKSSKPKSSKSSKSSTQSQISVTPTTSLPKTGIPSSTTNSSTVTQHVQATQPPIHFPPATQSIHGNPTAIGGHAHSKPMPNHVSQLMPPTPQLPPGYGLSTAAQHHMSPHSLHNPYYQTHPHYPSSAHLSSYPTPGHQMNNQQMPPNFSPQIASQLANQWRFSMPSYPHAPFYDPSFAQYFGHPANYPPMGNPYYPQPPPPQSNQGVQSNHQMPSHPLPPHSSQLNPPPNLLPTTNSTQQVNNTTTKTTTSQSATSK